MPVNNGWTASQYRLYRFCLGLYVLVHFLQLLPSAPEVFSNQGVLPAASSPLLLPLNVLALSDSPWFVTIIVIGGATLAAMLAAGFRDRLAALLLWYVWACLFGRNPLIANPSLPFIGWLLLAHVAIPSCSGSTRSWRFPDSLHLAGWALLSLAYSYSGYSKLVSPSWVDGSALRFVLQGPLARPTYLTQFLLNLPMLKLLTWGTLGLELLFAPLALFRKLRPWLWLAMLLLHVSLIVLLDFADLSLGMVLFHFFTFDPKWLPRRERHLMKRTYCR